MTLMKWSSNLDWDNLEWTVKEFKIEDLLESWLQKIVDQNPHINLLEYTLCSREVDKDGECYREYWLDYTEDNLKVTLKRKI